MFEYVLRALSVLILAVLLLVFGWYFSFGTDTLQHDWIFFGGGVLSLLSGLACLGFFVMLLKLRQEFGDDIASDVGYPELAAPPPAGRGGQRPAPADDEGGSEE